MSEPPDTVDAVSTACVSKPVPAILPDPPATDRSGAPASWNPRVGLCSLCHHARTVTSRKGSTFWLCDAAKDDPSLRKYPPLPVRDCHGFRKQPM